MDIWKHGAYLDTWSFVHFLSGFISVGIFYKIGYEFVLSLIFSFLILIAWEFFEFLIKIIEPSMNVLLDVIVGLLGILFGTYVFYFLNGHFNIYFYSALIITIILSVWGFTDFLKRGYR